MLAANNIRYTYGGKAALAFPDKIKIEKSKNLLLIGASGCGKTTLLNLLSGLLRSADCDISFQGNAYKTLSNTEMDRLRGKHFGFVFQKNHLIGHLNIIQNITLACSGAGIKPPAGRIKTLIDGLGLTGKENRKASDLSQGEAQRVSIARALAHTPDIIFADEPTSALDDHNANRVMSLLREQSEKTGASLIVSTHDSRIKTHFKAIMEIAS